MSKVHHVPNAFRCVFFRSRTGFVWMVQVHHLPTIEMLLFCSCQALLEKHPTSNLKFICLKICEFILFVMLVYWSLFFLNKTTWVTFRLFSILRFLIWQRRSDSLLFELHFVQLEVMGRSEGFASFDDELRSWSKHIGLLYAFHDVISIKYSTVYCIMIYCDMIWYDMIDIFVLTWD